MVRAYGIEPESDTIITIDGNVLRDVATGNEKRVDEDFLASVGHRMSLGKDICASSTMVWWWNNGNKKQRCIRQCQTVDGQIACILQPGVLTWLPSGDTLQIDKEVSRLVDHNGLIALYGADRRKCIGYADRWTHSVKKELTAIPLSHRYVFPLQESCDMPFGLTYCKEDETVYRGSAFVACKLKTDVLLEFCFQVMENTVLVYAPELNESCKSVLKESDIAGTFDNTKSVSVPLPPHLRANDAHVLLPLLSGKGVLLILRDSSDAVYFSCAPLYTIRVETVSDGDIDLSNIRGTDPLDITVGTQRVRFSDGCFIISPLRTPSDGESAPAGRQ